MTTLLHDTASADRGKKDPDLEFQEEPSLDEMKWSQLRDTATVSETSVPGKILEKVLSSGKKRDRE